MHQILMIQQKCNRLLVRELYNPQTTTKICIHQVRPFTKTPFFSQIYRFSISEYLLATISSMDVKSWYMSCLFGETIRLWRTHRAGIRNAWVLCLQEKSRSTHGRSKTFLGVLPPPQKSPDSSNISRQICFVSSFLESVNRSENILSSMLREALRYNR